MEHSETCVQEEISKDEFRAAQDVGIQAQDGLFEVTECKSTYENNTPGSESFFLPAVKIFRSAKLWAVLIRL